MKILIRYEIPDRGVNRRTGQDISASPCESRGERTEMLRVSPGARRPSRSQNSAVQQNKGFCNHLKVVLGE